MNPACSRSNPHPSHRRWQPVVSCVVVRVQVHRVRRHGNQVLAELLTELGWSPRALARKVNRLHGAGTVAESAPYHWRDSGGLPRPPIPA
ncbi:carph-isopro domain-containing protein [Pseudonocardia kunmingensis]|uniref:carph-isopro domain-containing protein n=1 Tax=Pseudonocardia kunmingensis TaxID=630975 RepID=UPI003CCC6629